MEFDGPERPGKRPHSANGRAAMDQDHGIRKVPPKMLNRQGTMESSKQYLTNGRAGCSSQLPLEYSNDRGKKHIAPYMISGDGKFSFSNHKKDLLILKTEESTDSIPSSLERGVPVRRPGTSILPAA